jgi:DNA-binding NarL/FixJ family response regulator
MKLILVDDNIHFRDDLKFFLENKLVHQVIAEVENKEDLYALGNLSEADIILMDLALENLNDFNERKKILMYFPQLKIIAMIMKTSNAILQKVRENGFKGYLFKTEIFTSLETVLQSVCTDKFVFPDKTKYSVSRMIVEPVEEQSTPQGLVI